MNTADDLCREGSNSAAPTCADIRCIISTHHTLGRNGYGKLVRGKSLCRPKPESSRGSLPPHLLSLRGEGGRAGSKETFPPILLWLKIHSTLVTYTPFDILYFNSLRMATVTKSIKRKKPETPTSKPKVASSRSNPTNCPNRLRFTVNLTTTAAGHASSTEPLTTSSLTELGKSTSGFSATQSQITGSAWSRCTI